MKQIVPGRQSVLHIIAALASGVVILAAQIETAFGQKPSTPVTVVNPEVPVTVTNPATDPVPTEQVDEPGRNPYLDYQVSDTNGICSRNTCGFFFAKVPAGKRLVITYISAAAFLVNDIETSNPVANVWAEVSSNGKDLLHLPLASGPGFGISSAALTHYVEAGLQPFLQVFYVTNPFPNSVRVEATIVGHLVSVP
jgi:hypothetical protein